MGKNIRAIQPNNVPTTHSVPYKGKVKLGNISKLSQSRVIAPIYCIAGNFGEH